MKLALWQTAPGGSRDSCMARLGLAITKAASAGADLFISPEMCVGGYNIGAAAARENAQSYTAVRHDLCALAATYQIALVIGLPSPSAGLPFNSCVIIDKVGVARAPYHKTHLFGDVDRAQFWAGDTVSPVIELGGWRLGLAICYDIEFPEVARDLALRGADLIVTPTANMAPFDSVATRLVPARAEENAVFVAYCNYVGAEGAFKYNGLSCVCGPDGSDLIRADKFSEALLYATIDRDALRAARDRQCHLRDRRPELYGKLI
jgi:predicted amidohydrolase